MKLLVVALLACVAAAAAQDVEAEPQYNQDDSQAEIVTSDFQRDEEGGYSSAFDTTNEIQQSSRGESEPGPEPETGSYRMEGKYSYYSPEGQKIEVTWFADKTGFHAESAAIPVAPEALF